MRCLVWATVPLAILLHCGIGLRAQVMPLRFSKVTKLPGQHVPAIIAPMKCGPDGHIFVRFADDPQASSISVISPDEEAALSVSASVVSDVRDGHVEDFAPGPNGETYLLLSREPTPGQEEEYIAKFDDTGTYVSATKLSIDFHARRLAIFAGTQEFVITGYRLKGEALPNVPVLSVTGLFDSAGQLIRYVALPRDIQDSVKVKHFHEGGHSITQHAVIDMSSLQASNDGNIYLMRATPAGPVYSISPGGAVHRIILIPPGEQADLLSIKVDGGRLVAEYNRYGGNNQRWHVLELFDLHGHLLRQTEIAPEKVGFGLACYRNSSFSFLLTNQDGNLRLAEAPAR